MIATLDIFLTMTEKRVRKVDNLIVPVVFISYVKRETNKVLCLFILLSIFTSGLKFRKKTLLGKLCLLYFILC